LKETLEEEQRFAPQSSRESLRDPIPSTVQNMRNPQEEDCPSPSVVEISTAHILWGEDERRLIGVGWEPKERSGQVIWANPATGFYCSQEVALLRLGREARVL
jgi:hypothetical protein